MTPKKEAESLATQFAPRLKTFRKSAGLTQEELSEKAECSAIALSKIETGVNLPSFELLIALASALDVPVSDLIGTAKSGRSASKKQAAALVQLEEAARDLPVQWIETLINVAKQASEKTPGNK